MKRAAIIGGVIAVTSVAAFGIVQAGWWTLIPLQKAARTASTASAGAAAATPPNPSRTSGTLGA